MRHRKAIRAYLGTTSYDDAAERLVRLKDVKIDLPAFSTLDRLVNHLRTEVHERIYDHVAQHPTIRGLWGSILCWLSRLI